MDFPEIRQYCESRLHKPFFLVLGDEEYACALSEIKGQGVIELIRVSDRCPSLDKRPDLDGLKELLRTIDIDCDTNKAALLGLGEYLALLGKDEAANVINDLKDFNLGSAHLVILLRCINAPVNEMLDADPRLKDRQIAVRSSEPSSLHYRFMHFDFGSYGNGGIKGALKDAEDDLSGGLVCADTDLKFPDAICQVDYIEDCFGVLEQIDPRIGELKDMANRPANEDLWENLLAEIKVDGSLEITLKKHAIAFAVNDEFFSLTKEQEYKNWLQLITARLFPGQCDNPYLSYVASISDTCDAYVDNALNAILDLDQDASDYGIYYQARKSLLGRVSEHYIAPFVQKSRETPQRALRALTDNTDRERREIVALVAENGIPDCLSDIYPKLYSYLSSYQFCGTEIDDCLTRYFNEYRKLKVTNYISESFLETVERFAAESVSVTLKSSHVSFEKPASRRISSGTISPEGGAIGDDWIEGKIADHWFPHTREIKQMDCQGARHRPRHRWQVCRRVRHAARRAHQHGRR